MYQENEVNRREQTLLAQAVKLLARREHSASELALKLIRRGYEAAEIDAVLDECKARGWLDDQRYAEIYVRQRKALLFGPVRILAELQQRGVQYEPDCLRETPESEWCANAARLREKKFGIAASLDWNGRGREGRFLGQRGFTMSQIEYALQRRPLTD